MVPDSTDLALENHRVQMSAVVLYADLADSTELATTNQEIAAEVFKDYLQGATRLIRANGGEVRSFDGDRVMGVFIGEQEKHKRREMWLADQLLFYEAFGSTLYECLRLCALQASNSRRPFGNRQRHCAGRPRWDQEQ